MEFHVTLEHKLYQQIDKKWNENKKIIELKHKYMKYSIPYIYVYKDKHGENRYEFYIFTWSIICTSGNTEQEH